MIIVNTKDKDSKLHFTGNIFYIMGLTASEHLNSTWESMCYDRAVNILLAKGGLWYLNNFIEYKLPNILNEGDYYPKEKFIKVLNLAIKDFTEGRWNHYL